MLVQPFEEETQSRTCSSAALAADAADEALRASMISAPLYIFKDFYYHF
jgi:hypothetical protein